MGLQTSIYMKSCRRLVICRFCCFNLVNLLGFPAWRTKISNYPAKLRSCAASLSVNDQVEVAVVPLGRGMALDHGEVQALADYQQNGQ